MIYRQSNWLQWGFHLYPILPIWFSFFVNQLKNLKLVPKPGSSKKWRYRNISITIASPNLSQKCQHCHPGFFLGNSQTHLWFLQKFQHIDSKSRPFSSSGLDFRRKTQNTNMTLKVDWICPETTQKFSCTEFARNVDKKGAWIFQSSRFFGKATITNRKKSFEKLENSCSSAEIWPIPVTMKLKRVPECSYRPDASSK